MYTKNIFITSNYQEHEMSYKLQKKSLWNFWDTKCNWSFRWNEMIGIIEQEH